MDDMNANASGSSRLEEGGGRGVEWRVRGWVLSPSESSTTVSNVHTYTVTKAHCTHCIASSWGRMSYLPKRTKLIQNTYALIK